MATAVTSGVWPSMTASPPELGGLGTSNVRWGVPAGGGGQSGYRFAGSSVEVLTDGTEFVLGTFTHDNFPVYGFQPNQFDVDLRVHVEFNGGALVRDFSFRFHRDAERRARAAGSRRLADAAVARDRRDRRRGIRARHRRLQAGRPDRHALCQPGERLQQRRHRRQAAADRQADPNVHVPHLQPRRLGVRLGLLSVQGRRATGRHRARHRRARPRPQADGVLVLRSDRRDARAGAADGDELQARRRRRRAIAVCHQRLHDPRAADGHRGRGGDAQKPGRVSTHRAEDEEHGDEDRTLHFPELCVPGTPAEAVEEEIRSSTSSSSSTRARR